MILSKADPVEIPKMQTLIIRSLVQFASAKASLKYCFLLHATAVATFRGLVASSRD